MKKMTLAAAGAGRRTAMLAAVSTMALTALANAQSAGDDEAAARVAARYGVMLDTISVYADRNARQALDLPQNVTVIGRQELDERMVRDVQDLVRYEPGITVAKTTSGTDPFGNLAGFTIRGVSNNRVQMLVDGTRVIESIVDGNRDFVNMANLKAVEIIRGPAGVMWGADALGWRRCLRHQGSGGLSEGPQVRRPARHRLSTPTTRASSRRVRARCASAISRR